ncbi:MAG: pentapeptide repeat-containing protein [Cyanomargarita calcarea GSE-NOS-MK-12-04C]|jgi:uncharacterized protein YjbI with pentapeptide repeats|uniref:Pentapeptide repeat-containing protein n=1 Tax=Cyanomargarita calcarea GSE-NOS-MK-12-04C TaxID=2839659 RepID=A0A951UWK6_9CYAN|nr:pentapeptide repeat-containing protein [Cyanomargarita calcarea GSE-NOS-MK-12-04C]
MPNLQKQEQWQSLIFISFVLFITFIVIFLLKSLLYKYPSLISSISSWLPVGKKTIKGSLKQRFIAVLEHLRNQYIEIRLEAIYELVKITSDYPESHWQTMEILATFVRNNAPLMAENIHNELSAPIRSDIQAALSAIANRDASKDTENEILDLSRTDIRGANLVRGNLQRINLYHTNLQGANLCEVNLQMAILSAANLEEANLVRANLHQAILSAANLRGANLSHANLNGASLFLANLQGANLDSASLDKANLREVSF